MKLFYPLFMIHSVLSSVIKSIQNESSTINQTLNGDMPDSPLFLKIHNRSFLELTPILNRSKDGHKDQWELVVPESDMDMERLRYRRGPTISPFHEDNSDFYSNNPNVAMPTPPPIYHVDFSTASVGGMRIEAGEKGVSYGSYGISEILADVPVSIRLFGSKFSNHTIVRFATELKTRGDDCDDTSSTKTYTISDISLNLESAMVEANLAASKPDEFYYICVRENDTDMPWVHQGADTWLMVKSVERFLPFWLQAILICVLLLLSGLFAGLTLGLLSLDTTSLKILANTGEEKQRMYAKTILPLRSRGNYLLCSLVLGNVLVNSTLTIILDDLTTGLLAVTISTGGIVIFGEIIPQAVCSRNGLAIGAKTVGITKFLMFITCPMAWPLSKLLDRMLGEEIGSVYTRERLKELLRVTKDYHGLETEEVGIISGALEMRTKTVKDIMVRIENVFMLPIDAVLDFDTMAEVEYHGYSRIPIYEKERTNIVALLNVKQLTLLDANDNIPLKTVIEYYQNNLFFVFENTQLNYMFKAFKEGKSGHMAFVQQVNRDGPGDPFYETIGLVTMEDVLEELLQAEIMDESDIGKLEARKSSLYTVRPKNSVPFHFVKHKPKLVDIPPPLALAAVQFLSTSVEPFKKEIMSVAILNRLVRNSAEFIKLPKHRGTQKMPDLFLYEAGKPSEYFVIILEGRVEVTVGKEKLTYESGAFTTFGKDFLINELATEKSGSASPVSLDKPDPKVRRTFVPDYTVRITTDLHYLMLKYSAYKAAMLATEIERANSKSENKDWQDDIEKMLESGDDDTISVISEVGKRGRISRDNSFKRNSENNSENHSEKRLLNPQNF